MNVEFIQRFCLSFSQATQNLQWGDDLCFKVGMNIFAVLNLNAVRPSAVELHS
jgi:predicted DNA-binding protein (MmcQ/YjbR family)